MCYSYTEMAVLQWVEDLVAEELGQERPDIARLSIALGLCEQYYTSTKSVCKLPNKVLGCSRLDAGPALSEAWRS